MSYESPTNHELAHWWLYEHMNNVASSQDYAVTLPLNKENLAFDIEDYYKKKLFPTRIEKILNLIEVELDKLAEKYKKKASKIY